MHPGTGSTRVAVAQRLVYPARQRSLAARSRPLDRPPVAVDDIEALVIAGHEEVLAQRKHVRVDFNHPYECLRKRESLALGASITSELDRLAVCYSPTLMAVMLTMRRTVGDG